jgi:hypothetical protein
MAILESTLRNGTKSNTDPLLGTLRDNGGETKTMALMTGSPAIDGMTYTTPSIKCPDFEQRDYPRTYNVIYDIGAVEQYYRALPPIVIKN